VYKRQGEGNQAYGHGLYFAGNERVAKNYRNNLAGSAQGTPYVADEVRGWLDGAGGDYEKAANEAKSHFREFGDQMDRDQVAELKNAIYLLDNKKEAFGHMYKVKLNVKPEELLDWDKPLSEQHPNVQAALARMDPDQWHPEGSDYDPSEPGGMAYQRIIAAGNKHGAIGEHLRAGNPMKRGDKWASEALMENGIKGIRYLDAGSRGDTDGDPTHNYVMFHHDPVQVVDKYEYGGTVAIPKARDVSAALALTRRFTKDGTGATMALKSKGK
jgi:hypothetical protein